MVKDLDQIRDNATLNDLDDIPIAKELQEAFMDLQDVDDLEVFTFELNKIIKDKVLHKEFV